MSIALILLLGFLLLASAFFSGTETAFFSLHRMHLRRLERDPRRRAGRVLRVLGRPTDLLTTVLVGNTLVNVGLSVAATTLFLRLIGRAGVEVSIAATTIAVLVVGEITPKTLAVNYPERFSRSVVDAYRVARVLLSPLVAVASFLTNLVLRLFGLSHMIASASGVLSRTELGHILEGADEEGVMTAHESELAQNIMEFSSTRVEQVMTPRVDMIAAPVDLDRAALETMVVEAKHSRIPIYRRTIDEIFGYLRVRDFLLNPDRRLEDLIGPVAVFPERAPAAGVFYEIQKSRIPMVIVVNEYGETVGLVTREDLLEELVGDIYDEYESASAPIRELRSGLYQVGGQVNLDELNEELGLALPSEDAVTLNGFLTGLFEQIPKRGQKIRWNGVEFIVTEVLNHRIQQCLVSVEAESGVPVEDRRTPEAQGEPGGSSGRER